MAQRTTRWPALVQINQKIKTKKIKKKSNHYYSDLWVTTIFCVVWPILSWPSLGIILGQELLAECSCRRMIHFLGGFCMIPSFYTLLGSKAVFFPLSPTRNGVRYYLSRKFTYSNARGARRTARKRNWGCFLVLVQPTNFNIRLTARTMVTTPIDVFTVQPLGSFWYPGVLLFGGRIEKKADFCHVFFLFGYLAVSFHLMYNKLVGVFFFSTPVATKSSMLTKTNFPNVSSCLPVFFYMI